MIQISIESYGVVMMLYEIIYRRAKPKGCMKKMLLLMNISLVTSYVSFGPLNGVELNKITTPLNPCCVMAYITQSAMDITSEYEEDALEDRIAMIRFILDREQAWLDEHQKHNNSIEYRLQRMEHTYALMDIRTRLLQFLAERNKKALDSKKYLKQYSITISNSMMV